MLYLTTILAMLSVLPPRILLRAASQQLPLHPAYSLAPQHLFSTSSRIFEMSIPKTQKAVQFEKTGGPEVLKVNEIPVPEVGPEQALLKVEYAGVNFLDVSNYRFQYPCRRCSY